MPTKNPDLRTMELVPNKNISFPIGTIRTVKKYYDSLDLDTVFEKYKAKGRDLNSLIQALLSYRLTENQSLVRGSEWTNRPDVLSMFNLEQFEQRTLYRVLEIIGKNYEEIIADIQDIIFEHYDFEHTNINMDWTSFILWGNKCSLGKRGYSRNHRPDKKQITVGISELSDPINIPIGMTIKEGNINDQTHFTDTFNQIRSRLRKNSMVVFDQGGNRKKNLAQVENAKLKYLTRRQINKSDEKNRINGFDKSKAELIDEKNGVYGIKYEWPSRNDFFYFSEDLQKNQIESKLRKVDRLFEEAESIQNSIDNNRGLPKRYRINNPLIDCTYSYQTRLSDISEVEAKKILKKAAITGREGFFCLVSNKQLTLHDALSIYRKKDSIEKIFHSLKNEINITPLRVWSDYGIHGALIIGFLAQLIISLIRFEHEELKHISPKFIRNSLSHLTVTVEMGGEIGNRYILSNFNPISLCVLGENQAIT
jgi:transposase